MAGRLTEIDLLSGRPVAAGTNPSVVQLQAQTIGDSAKEFRGA